MAHRLAELYTSLDEATLRSVFLEIVRVLPESRAVTVDFLTEQISDQRLMRTVSVDNVVESTSGFKCSSIATKIKGRKQRVRSNGHTFLCHNYTKPTVCAVCSNLFTGLTHQGYQCKACLMDVHPGCLNGLWKCRGVELAKARKQQAKKTRRRKTDSIVEADIPWPGLSDSAVLRAHTVGPSTHKPTRRISHTPIKYFTVRKISSTSDSVVGVGEFSQDQRQSTSKKNKESALVTPTSSNDSSKSQSHNKSDPSDSASHLKLDNGSPIAMSSTVDNDDDDEDEDDGYDQMLASPTSSNASKESPNQRSPYSNVIDGDLIPEQSAVEMSKLTPKVSVVEADSESDEYFEENSSDNNSSDDDEHDDSTPYGGNKMYQPAPGITMKKSIKLKVAGKTGASADWKRHGASFKARLSDTHQHKQTSLGIFLDSSNKLELEFANIPENRVNMLTTPKSTEAKNRYMNILPNNHSRVVLKQIGDDETSSYINANWIEGFDEVEDEFIACQGPLENTVEDFWRMVWECGVRVIAMNTGIIEDGKDKCVRYWPEKCDGSADSVLTFGGFTIQASRVENVTPEFQRTSLQCTHLGETRELKHIWWTDWPDKGVPRNCNGIHEFISSIRTEQKAGGPVVIHCSAGIGRTGCFLTINYCMKQYDALGIVDILNCVGRLRRDRGMTVQTESQYRFIHQVLLRYMNGTLAVRDGNGAEKKNAPRESQTDTARLRVIAPKDRPLGSNLAKRTSSRALISNLTKRKSSKELLAPPNATPKPVTTRAPAPVVGQSFDHGNHLFQAKTFVRPTQCGVCCEYLAGLALQGIRCSQCKQDVHFWCLPTVDPTCILATNVKRQKSGLPSWPPTRPGGSTKLKKKHSVFHTGLMSHAE